MYRIIEKYFGEADEFNMKRAFSVYSLLFLLLMSFTYLLFYSAGKGPFQFEVDGLTYFSRIAYIGRYVRSVLQNIFLNKSLSFPVYDFRIGLGDDVFIYMWVGLLNPIILFTAPFFSIEHTEKLYWLICFLHMYLSGVSFLFFCSYKKMDVLASACGAIAYVFSGFALFYFLKHFLFIVPMILLPLMFLALEKVLHGEKPVLFIAMVVLAFLINFVFACMMIIMTFICGVFRFFDIYKEKRFKHFCSILFKCSVGFLTAVMLVAPFLFPVVFKFLESPRNLDIVPSGGLLLFNKYFVFDCITYLFAPGGMWWRTSMIPVCIFALVCLFKKKGDRGLKLFILFSFLGLVSPMVGYFFNAGKYVTDRWMFILPFVLAYAFTLMFHRIAKWRDEDKKLCIIATGAYALFVLISYVFVIKRVNMYAFYASIAMLSMVLLFSLLKRYNLTYRRVLLFCMTGFFALMNIYFLYSTDYVNYLKTFGPKDRAYIVFNELSINMLDEIEIPYSYSFFRSDATNVYPLFSYNLVKQYGLTGYTSLLPPVYADSQFALENIGAWHFYRIQGFNERAALDTLASVKYFIAPRGKEALVPYGFIRIAEDENNFLSYSVFENNYFLPIGYTYSNYITQEDYKRLSALDKQETLLQTVVLEISPHGFGKSRNLKFSEVSVPCNITNMDGVEWDDGVLRINKKNAVITLSFPVIANAEMYLRIQGLNVNHERVSPNFFNVIVEYSKIKKTFFIAQNTFSQYHGRENFLVKLCTSTKSSEETCSITWPVKGTFKLDDIQVYAQPMDNYPAQINKLREDVLENIYVGNDKVSGTISLKKNKILCLSIPYSKGWHAKVDGKKTELLKANSLFMALPLEAGDHKIELEYHVPGFRLGLCFFALGAVILSGMIIHDKKKKKPMKENGALPPVQE